MAKKKSYVIAPYGSTFAMYEFNDFRLVEGSFLTGKFIKTNEVRGIFNGYEIGKFICDSGQQFLVFNDHTARPMI